jgi:hypothetical protein
LITFRLTVFGSHKNPKVFFVRVDLLISTVKEVNMNKIVHWADLDLEMKTRGIRGLSISNGQHLINSDGMIIGHVSTPIGEEPSWVFYEEPAYKASDTLIHNCILVSRTSLSETLFQAATTLTPPFKRSSELVTLLQKSLTFENK